MSKCPHCGNHTKEYVLSFQEDNELPAVIHIWSIKDQEMTFVGGINEEDLLQDAQLSPLFFCMVCHTAKPMCIPSSLYNEIIKQGSQQ